MNANNTDMTPEEAIQFIGEEAQRQGASHYDALAGESDSLGLDLYEGKVKNTEIASSRGIGIRLFSEGCPGYAFTERFTKESIAQTVRDAMAHTKLTGPLEVSLPDSVADNFEDLELWNPDLEAVSLDQMKALGLELEEHAHGASEWVENVPYLGVSRSSGKSWICNSKGSYHSFQSNSVSAGLGVVAAKEEFKKMGVYSNSAFDFNHFDARYMAQLAAERGVSLLGAKPVSGGAFPVVLSNRVSAQLLSMYSSSFYAEVVQKGQSKLKDKLGDSIAQKTFSLYSEPHLKGRPGSHWVDSEGVVTSPLAVVQDGVLQEFLYNLESAKKAGRLSNGHGSRSYSGEVGTGFANYIVPCGDKGLKELLSQYPKCLYVTNLEGGSGCSPVSGDISIGVQGFWYEQGENTQPVDGMTMSGNFFDLLQGIQGISNQYSDALSSYRVPDLLIESMFLAG
jgi:PmbA protein